jgi:hypothetical protein
MIMWRMRITCWTTEATNARTEYVILTVFQLQQLLQECAPLLRYMHIACLVK